MLLLTALAAAQPPELPSRAHAQANVRIVRAVRATKDEWKRLPANRRHEKVIVEDGRRLTIRLIEFE